MRIGVLGGTFDPPHIAHLILAEQAREQVALDEVWFIPAGDPWRKAEPRCHTCRRTGSAMTRLAIAGVPGFLVDDCEVKRDGPTYTVDTLRELRAQSTRTTSCSFSSARTRSPTSPTGTSRSDSPTTHTSLWRLVRALSGPETLPFDPLRVVRMEMPYIAVSSDGPTGARPPRPQSALLRTAGIQAHRGGIYEKLPTSLYQG